MKAQRLRAAASACAVMALVAGCSNAGGESSSDGPNTLTYAVAGGGLTQLDPNTVASAALVPLTTLLYNGLTKFGPDMSIQPDLAESWEASPDQKVWTFKLRSDATFHDGRQFTAEDAVKNITRVLDPATGSQARVRLSMVSDVRALDETTLEVTLKEPNALLPTALVSVKMSDVDHIDQVNEDANGTGPYKLEDFVPDDHVTLVPNDAYWGDKPQLDEIRIVTAADTTAAVTSLRSRELDVVWSVPPLDVAQLAADPGLEVYSAETGSGSVIWELDTTSAPFEDKRARQALAYAIDRTELLNVGYDDRGVAADANVVINPEQPAYNSGLVDYGKDLDKAKELFAEAGVTTGTKLVFWTTAGRNPQWVTMAQVLQGDLKSIGIDLEIKQIEPTTWLEKFFPAGKSFPGTIVANYLSSPLEPSLQLNFFRTGICECNWSNTEYDALHAKAVATGDEAERDAIYGDMQAILNDEVPVIVPIMTSQITVAQERVTGLWVQSDGAVHLETAGVSD